jgi:hypothetical protein
LFIPTGKKTVTYPLRAIGGFKTNTQFKYKYLIAGIVLLLIGFSSIKSFGFISILLGVISIIKAFETVIVVTSAGTGQIPYSHVPWEAKEAKKMIRELNQLIVDNT